MEILRTKPRIRRCLYNCVIFPPTFGKLSRAAVPYLRILGGRVAPFIVARCFCYIEICMDSITVEVWDTTGNKKQTVEVPADATVNRLVAVLVDRMNLPRHSPDNQL